MSTPKKYDNTALSCLQRCEQEYIYRHVRKLRATGLSASAHFGQVVHDGVRALYAGEKLLSAEENVLQARGAIRRAWASSTAHVMMQNMMRKEGTWGCEACGVLWSHGHEVPHHVKCPALNKASRESWVLAVLDEKKQQLTAHHASVLVHKYNELYIGKQPYECVWNEGYAESATECALPDRAVRASDGKLYAMDLKTTGMYVSATWQRSFEHSQQVAMQLDTLEAELGERVEGFVLDAVHVPRTTSVLNTDFVRYGPLVYTDALRAELRAQRGQLAERANALAKLPEAALKTPSACVRYSSLCDFFDLCQADPADREMLVQIKLDRRELEVQAWDPKHRDGD
ncbi:MAG: PD-(D/E)XK nuclease family protein [Acidobacteriales bacterium]|nr:PD-(D/E)XK nuclease family protein [Terriglobales bacterium]